MVTQIPKKNSPRPFLKWAGGKSRLIQQYKDYFPKSFDTYYEPFLGGGAVFFYLQPQRAILTDINAELINAYCCVRDEVEDLINELKKHQERHSLNNPNYYYDVRDYEQGSNLEKAARLIYLNKTCFNGLYRVNSQGKFNVPMGRYKNPGICQEDLLRSASEALKDAEIKVNDFTAILDYAVSSNDFVFCDPPYYPLSSTSNFTAYSQNSFDEKDQERLRNTCAELASRGVKVMICNSHSEIIKSLYQEINFNIRTIKAPRSINSNTQSRGLIDELLITSY
ncbi:MAG TPA: DNA adenine methylase [Nostocaceae cyanobacterium]|nr:DNA adenine methylase [Nostocaceae cyanobacterium]